jgi:hypothetical protein
MIRCTSSIASAVCDRTIRAARAAFGWYARSGSAVGRADRRRDACATPFDYGTGTSRNYAPVSPWATRGARRPGQSLARDTDARFVDPILESTLERWRDWRGGDAPNPLGYARVSGAGTSNAQGFRSSSVPTALGPAKVIQNAIEGLQPTFRAALTVEYLYPELTQEARCRVLGVNSRQTYVRRVDEAKRALRDTLKRLREQDGKSTI